MRHLNLSPEDARDHAWRARAAIVDGSVKRERNQRLASTDAIDGCAGDARVNRLNALRAPWLISIGWRDIDRSRNTRTGKRSAKRMCCRVIRPDDETFACCSEAVVTEGIAVYVE